MRNFFHDVQYAWLSLRRQPGFAWVVLITLSLGIGVNTAVFSIFYSVLMRNLPYGNPERLVVIWANFRSRGNANVAVSGEILREIQQRQRSMSDVAGIWVTPPRTFPGNPPEQVKSAFVTTNFFDVLGVRAASGRTFAGDNDGPAMVIADPFFRRRFAADVNLVGTQLKDAGGNLLIGVLPADFELHFAPAANVPGDVQVFQSWGPGFLDGKNYIIRLVGRLKPGVAQEAAQDDFNRLAQEIRDGYSEFAREDLHFVITGMQSDAFRDVQPALSALFAGGAFVLLICCVNIASLLLARANDRRKEIALRLALGASRGRIMMQLLAEAAVLGLLGGAAGMGVGWAVFRALATIRPERLARIDEGGLMWPVLAFTAAASIGATLVFAMVPSLQTWGTDCVETLRAKGHGWFGRVQRWSGRSSSVRSRLLSFLSLGLP